MPINKKEFKALLEDNLSLELSTAGCACGCGDAERLEIKVKFDGVVICSDFIYLSSLQKD